MSATAWNADGVAMASTHDIDTPEGVPLEFEIAGVGARLLAFMIDFSVIATLVFIFLGGVIAASILGSGLGAFGFVLWFAAVNLYFPILESIWQGRTVGKLAMGIRVIDRRGAPLTLQALCARNFMRDLELWLPLKVFVSGGAFWAGLPDWAIPVCAAWVVLLLLFPLANRRHLRLGDVIGGTVVVTNPKARLLEDLTKRQPTGTAAPEFEFSPEQLEIYGIYELQVLEELLRQGRRADSKALGVVSRRIRSKIGWEKELPANKQRRFLGDFYRAQRLRLEEKLRSGHRQQRKRES